MKTILKWPGGKEKELPIIRENMPEYSGRFIEPFVGGGAVYFDVNKTDCCINDKSAELINFYNCIKQREPDLSKYLQIENDEFSLLGTLADSHSQELLYLYNSELSIADFILRFEDIFSSIAQDDHSVFIKELDKNLSNKIKRSHKLETEQGPLPDADRLDNIEAALKSAYYMYIRYLQNKRSEFSAGRRAALFFFVREFCYSSMFRYNAQGEFNVPYGGISYNRKDFQKKINYILSPCIGQKLSNTQIYNLDFEDFLQHLELTKDDFIFLDPPYDSDFSTYAQNAFGPKEQIRLCECLKRTRARLLLIIKNTEFIYNLYKNYFNIKSFDKKYLVSFMNRNEKKVKHLLITNYS
ncbi:MAG: DNA adenine methylase [bacterium]|nr:DNA adenine methylase [bacterium]